MNTRIVICDDHEVVRIGLREAFTRSGFDVVAEATNGMDVVEVVRLAQPDLVLLDLQLPERDGIAACAAVVAVTTAPVVILSAYKDEPLEQEARRAGAAAFLLKSMPLPTLVDMVRLLTGTSPEGEEDEQDTPAPPLRRTPVTAEPLTTREEEILECLGLGLTNDEIATRLVISRATAKTHVSNVLRKLGLATRTQAALHARER